MGHEEDDDVNLNGLTYILHRHPDFTMPDSGLTTVEKRLLTALAEPHSLDEFAALADRAGLDPDSFANLISHWITDGTLTFEPLSQ